MSAVPSVSCGKCLHTCMFRDKIAQAKRLGKSITLKQSGETVLLFAHHKDERATPEHWVGAFPKLHIHCIQETLNEH